MKQMSLLDQARRLADVLRTICSALEVSGVDERSGYLRKQAERFRPLVAALEDAILRDKSREQAKDILSDIAPIMDDVSAADTKGEMGIFKGDTLNRYWHLHTIFQESRFSRESL